MPELAAASSATTLQQLHARLDAHYKALCASRETLSGDPPVFALEHGLSDADLETLCACVRDVISRGLGAQHWRHSWLPFAVYAAESGYDYIGDEFWPSFERRTPGWFAYGDRDRVRMWFTKFALDYGGAIPVGAFAKNFPIIAWPITHAVLPVYLQRYLAQLLYDFRMGLTADLLQDPEQLGVQLEARSWGYTERFRIFCSNTSLLGHVAAALLSGEGEESPYLLHSTLQRLVDGLEQERQARLWLQGARDAASRIRARGFQPRSPQGVGGGAKERLPNPTDPRLVLRRSDSGWRVYAQLPDLTGLGRRLPQVYEELRTKRARVEGAGDTMLARGRLAATSQEIRLTRWPDPEQAFVELEDGGAAVNAHLRDQIEITRGPVWLFKRRAPGVAVEIKGRILHPGGTYLVIHAGEWDGADLPGVTAVTLDADDANAYRLVVPDSITDAQVAAFVAAGLSVTSEVNIRPVGIVASAWDGVGAVEWLAGEPAIVAIRTQQAPSAATLALAGERYPLDWPSGENNLFLSLDDLPVGEHELRVTLAGEQQQTLVEGSLSVIVRDPRMRTETAEQGEGIRLLASPSRPSMSEIWEPGALMIAGPDGLSVDLKVTLRGDNGQELGMVQFAISLPLLDADWTGIAKKVRNDSRFIGAFDLAESLEVNVSRAGVGYASLTADRGFQPLRWQLLRDRDSNRAHLVDRTDSANTQVHLYRVEAPLRWEACDPSDDVVAPATGGLLQAIGGEGIDASASTLLPTRPNELFGKHPSAPQVPTGARTPGEVVRLASAYQRWATADLPGDVFAQHQRDAVLEAITSSVVSMISGARWAAVERRLVSAKDPLDLINEMQKLIGESDEQKHLAKTVGKRLYSWLDPVSLLTGFAEVTKQALKSDGLGGHDSAPRFLLTLAGRTGQILEWPRPEQKQLIEAALTSPGLLRAARFAVLGTRLLGESGDARNGF